MSIEIVKRGGGRISSVETGRVAEENDGVISISISGPAITSNRSGIPSSISTEEIRGKDAYGNEKFPFTGD